LFSNEESPLLPRHRPALFADRGIRGGLLKDP
jgi:hypothetical protein